MEEAARIDGCSELGLLWKIVLPLSKPVLATFTLFYAVGHWNNFFSALLYITDPTKWYFAGDAATDRNVIPICGWRYEFYGSKLCAATGAVD